MCNQQLIQLFISAKSSSHTRKLYQRVLANLNTVNLSQYTVEDAVKVKNGPKMQNLKPSSVKTYLNILKAFFNWLIEQKIINHNPFSNSLLKVRDLNQPNRPCLTREEVSQVLSRAKRKGLREHALILLLLSTGLRIGEAHKLRVNDFFEENGIIGLRVMGKGTKLRTVRVPKNVYQVILQYIEQAGIEDRLFPISSVYLQRLVSNITRKGAHCTRRTYATLAYNGDILALQQALGHSGLSQTQIYVRKQYGLADFPQIALTSRPKIFFSK